MLAKPFSLASVVALGGAVWAGCSGSSSNNGTIPDSDAGSSGGPDTTVDSGGQQPNPEAGPPGVTFTYGKCPAFAKCGGDVVGAWKPSGGCLSEDTFTEAKQTCPGLKESNVTINATGTLDVTATKVNQAFAVTVTASLEVPKSCVPLPGATCAQVELALKLGTGGLSFDTVTCTESGANCECQVGKNYQDTIDDTYTKTPDGTLSTPPTPTFKDGRTYDYCVKDGTLAYTETTKTQPLKLVIDVTKR
jgi:hypothetical protein